MKKLLSVALSFVMLISCFAVSSFSASAADLSKVPEYKLGDTFVAEYNSKTTVGVEYYAKFVPTETAIYEFKVESNFNAKDNAYSSVDTYIYDTAGEEVGWNFQFTGDEGTATVAAQLTAKRVYYFAMEVEDCTKYVYTTNVTIQKHTTHKLQNETVRAFYYKEYDIIEDGGTIQYCDVCGYEKQVSTIYAPKSISLSKTSYTYDGKAKKPSVTIKDRKGKKIDKSNYTVKYSKNKNIGTATVTVTFVGDKYYGEMTKTFKINPKGTSLSSTKASKKAFTAKWKKQSTKTDGYQIQYSTDKNFKKNNKTVTVKGNKTTSKKVNGLKAKKKYYVRVRTYKTVSNKKYYSSWSKAKSVTTKGSSSSSKKSSNSKSSSTVYVTPTGKKYHYSKSCAGKNAIKTDLSKAKKSHSPCKKCVS